VLPLKQVFAFDVDADRARRFAREAAAESGLDVRAISDLPAAVRKSDVCVTCTPSRRAFLKPDCLPPGMFLAAVGADDHDKQELHPRILAENRVVVDVLEQCAQIGELHHALAAGLMTREEVHADLADLVAGRRPGRLRAAEIFVFDSTGIALQDVAAAAALYRRAAEAGAGRRIDLLG
jgi:alanine dehydrogenase